MSSGLLVLATSVGGVSGVLDNKWLYRPGDIQRLRELIVEIYNMPPEERMNIGKRNRDHIEPV